MQGMRVATTVTPIHTVHPDMPLTTALTMLMEAGVSALPVVDAEGVLLDVYARSDITLLTRGSAYLHLAVRFIVFFPPYACALPQLPAFDCSTRRLANAMLCFKAMYRIAVHICSCMAPGTAWHVAIHGG